jgi:hypothetical protein
LKKGGSELILLRKSVFLKELIENIEAGSQTSLKYSEKITTVQTIQKWNAGKQFISVFSQKVMT